MCGIAGCVGVSFDEQKILASMRHRGPDAQKSFSRGEITFFHARLAIQDIAGGEQPMTRGGNTIVFNGEIYNHLQLRSKLLRHKEFTTNSDTETLLALYERFGLSFLDELDGMFAFCILDRLRNKLVFARDRAGKKPLYIWQDGMKIAFASELNTLKTIVPLQANEEMIGSYLRTGYMFGKSTPYLQTLELSAGSCAEIPLDSMRLRQWRWWQIEPFYKNRESRSIEEALKECDDILHLSVKRRLESSDLEVGAFLSGGIDSGLVSAVASQYVNKLRTFTVSFEGSYDEAPLARLVADRYGTLHEELNISMGNLNDNIETILLNYGEPFFDSSAIPSWYVAREAKKHISVVLNGDGADELFGGYRRYVPFAAVDLFCIPNFISSAISSISSRLPMPHEKMSIYNWLYRLLKLCGSSGLERYLAATSDIFEGYEHYLHTDPSSLDDMRDLFGTITSQPISGLSKIMAMDFESLLSGDLLVKMDIATMAHSLEGRSPFLSKEFLQFAPTLQDRYKVFGGKTKVLLRTLAQQYLPQELINAPKRGFEVPLKSWVDGILKERIHDALEGDSYSQRFIDREFLSRLLQNRIEVGAEKRAKMLWTLYSLEVWAKNHTRSQNV